MEKAKKTLKILYYVAISFVLFIAVLLVVSVFPITGNYKVMVVRSGSMAPAIKVGSLVAVKPSESYKIGDVVTFRTGKSSEPVTHRIYDIKVSGAKPKYITKGDANDTRDQKDILREDILGKVFLKIPYLGYAINFAQKPLGFGLVVVIPAAAIIGDEAKKIYEEIKKKKK